MPEAGVIGLGAALIAGVLSFLSPCVLPMVPVYTLYMAGTGSATAGPRRWEVMGHAALFVAGFGAVFTLGGVTVGWLGSIMPNVMRYLVQVGGILLILLGLNMMGLVSIGPLNMTRRLPIDAPARRGWWRSLVVGLVFAAGWTPCIGPVLTMAFSLAAHSQTAANGAALLGAYSLGLGLPFLAVAGLSGVALPALQRIGRHARAFSIASGMLLVIMGALLLSGMYTMLLFRLSALSAGI